MVDHFGMMLAICDDALSLALRTTERIIEIARESLEARGRFTIALCGGSTPEKTYSLLGRPERPSPIDWSRTFVFFGDERFVSHADSRSNYRMAEHALLRHVPIPPSHVIPVPTHWTTAANASEAYAREVASVFASFAKTEQENSTQPPAEHHPPPIPRFDLILLGIGEDGHTASLFPGAAALAVEDALVTWSLPGVLPPTVDRVTFTFPLLNAARNVMFIVSGEKKAAVLHEILEGDKPREVHPARGIHPNDGRLLWYLDRAAAARLSPSFLATTRA